MNSECQNHMWDQATFTSSVICLGFKQLIMALYQGRVTVYKFGDDYYFFIISEITIL